jgi:hypothetical protein
VLCRITSLSLQRTTSSCDANRLNDFDAGVFRRGIDGVEVSAVSVHPAGSLIAVSYRNGEVRVYRYPCQSQQVR